MHEAGQRRQSIDLMRIVAAFGIVWAHMQAPGRVEGYIALSLFIILTAFLSVRSLERGGGRRFWLGRLVRFGLPWVVWSAFYLWLELWRAGGWAEVAWLHDPAVLLYGPAIHLWFLPWVILTSPLIVLAVAWLTSAARVWTAAAVATPAGIGALWLHDHAGLGDPFGQWAFATVPLIYGILSAVRRLRGAVLAPLAFAAVATGVATFGWGSLAAPFLLSSALIFEAFWRAEVTGVNLTPVAQLAFGIYLAHPFWMLVWYRLAPGLLPGIPAGAGAALGAVAVFVAAAGSAWLIRRTLVGRFLA
jgi:peptidoglycan/LPS O-acetylase OafA/YrhL